MTIALRPDLLIVLLMLGVFLPASNISAESASVPDFDLSKWNSDQHVTLSDFAGKIVVLDFFAYWCAPCRRASKEIEGGIQRYYALKGGNSNGVPVQVVAVNIEKDKPKQTDRYIRDTGVELVLNDFDSELLGKLGGAATPFVVVIDGSRATQDKPDFRLIYQKAGFEGTRKLRQVIDSVERPESSSANPDNNPEVIKEATGAPILHKGEVSFEGMLATDIKLTSATFSYGQEQGGTDWQLSYTWNSIGVDYEPYKLFDFLGYPTHLDADYHGGQASLRQALSDSFTWLVSGGAYDGFTDYRSLWLANYYQQQFSFLPGYDAPHPRGFSVSTGLRWEYQPTTGFAEIGIQYARDEIAPGYEFEPLAGGLIQGRDTLYTYLPTLRFENILTPRVRTLHEFSLTYTTGRDRRFSYRGSINIALGERWVWRSTGGYAHEDPTLRAWFVGSTLEFEITPNWLVNLSGLYYHDTGEIENSLLISTAAPGLQTWQAGLGLRYVGRQCSFYLSAAPIWSDYESVEVGTRPFTNLYRDRAWLLVQAALSVEL